MKNESWTPGPWERSQSKESMRIYDTKGIHICDASIGSAKGTPYYLMMPQEEANANLIAAAPDMYEALNGTITYLLELKKLMDNEDAFTATIVVRISKIKAALSKANPQTQKA